MSSGPWRGTPYPGSEILSATLENYLYRIRQLEAAVQAQQAVDMPIAYEYYGLYDTTLGGLDNADTGGPFFPTDPDGGGTGAMALYASAGTPDDYVNPPEPFHNAIIGIGAWTYFPDAADFTLTTPTPATQIQVYPTWITGNSRPYVYGRKVGTGVFQKYSAVVVPDPASVVTYQLDLIQYERRLQFRVAADGSKLTGTNPDTWAEGDRLTCYWHTFLRDPFS